MITDTMCSLTVGRDEPVVDPGGDGVEGGVRRVESDVVLDARNHDLLLKSLLADLINPFKTREAIHLV